MDEDKDKGSLSVEGGVVTHLTVAWHRAICLTRKAINTVGQGFPQAGCPQAAGRWTAGTKMAVIAMEVKVELEKNRAPASLRGCSPQGPGGQPLMILETAFINTDENH